MSIFIMYSWSSAEAKPAALHIVCFDGIGSLHQTYSCQNSFVEANITMPTIRQVIPKSTTVPSAVYVYMHKISLYVSIGPGGIRVPYLSFVVNSGYVSKSSGDLLFKLACRDAFYDDRGHF